VNFGIKATPAIYDSSAVFGFEVPTQTRGYNDRNFKSAALDCSFDLGSRPAGKAMSDEDMKAELDRLRNENAALKKGASSSLRLKVSEKGALSVYGMGRFPVTLYKEQWLKLLGMSDEIRAFIAANGAQLKAKE
jgi:hypothetical protein